MEREKSAALNQMIICFLISFCALTKAIADLVNYNPPPVSYRYGLHFHHALSDTSKVDSIEASGFLIGIGD